MRDTHTVRGRTQPVQTESTESLIESLAAPGLDERVRALGALARRPTGESRLIPYLLASLGDTTVHDLGDHRGIGEIRELAAHAVAAERRRRGVVDTIRVGQVPRPLSVARLTRLENDHGVAAEGTPEQRYVRLRAKGFIPTRDLNV